jgi:hypothetical protein
MQPNNREYLSGNRIIWFPLAMVPERCVSSGDCKPAPTTRPPASPEQRLCEKSPSGHGRVAGLDPDDLHAHVVCAGLKLGSDPCD